MSVLGTIICSTLYEYQTPDGRIVPMIYMRLVTPEEREALLRADRGGLSYEEWRERQEREERT